MYTERHIAQALTIIAACPEAPTSIGSTALAGKVNSTIQSLCQALPMLIGCGAVIRMNDRNGHNPRRYQRGKKLTQEAIRHVYGIKPPRERQIAAKNDLDEPDDGSDYGSQKHTHATILWAEGFAKEGRLWRSYSRVSQ